MHSFNINFLDILIKVMKKINELHSSMKKTLQTQEILIFETWARNQSERLLHSNYCICKILQINYLFLQNYLAKYQTFVDCTLGKKNKTLYRINYISLKLSPILTIGIKITDI